jgi:hypothetical protein
LRVTSHDGRLRGERLQVSGRCLGTFSIRGQGTLCVHPELGGGARGTVRCAGSSTRKVAERAEIDLDFVSRLVDLDLVVP